jgi:hypothetical protein
MPLAWKLHENTLDCAWDWHCSNTPRKPGINNFQVAWDITIMQLKYRAKREKGKGETEKRRRKKKSKERGRKSFGDDSISEAQNSGGGCPEREDRHSYTM